MENIDVKLRNSESCHYTEVTEQNSLDGIVF